MFAKFQLETNKSGLVQELLSHRIRGEEIYKDFASQSQERLDEFICQNGIIDGTALKSHWFSLNHADIFISHSHKDIDLVKGLAGWLYDHFGLTAFIDSCCWGYCDNLLKIIDDQYCKEEGTDTYQYKLRNYSTSHVHMMLSSALSEMIDKTECILFVNTPNSICLKAELQDIAQNNNFSTLSPWIYHELSTASMMRITLPKRRSFSVAYYTNGHSFASSPMRICYDINRQLEGFIPLSDAIINEWKNGHDTQKNGLDELYGLLGLFD